MTRPRSTYTFGDQVVRSPDGSFEARTRDLLFVGVERSGAAVWEVKRRVAPKQVFVSDSGRAVVAGADDVLTFHDETGAIVGEVALLDHVDESQIIFTTAGRHWEDYFAGTFGEGCFVVEGRGREPLVFSLEGELHPGDATPILTARAAAVLSEACEPLRRDNTWSQPWAFAAIGWARVAGQLGIIDAIAPLEELARLPLSIHGYSSRGLRAARIGDDPVLVDRHAPDPVAQAVHFARLRLGVDSAMSTLQIGRRGRMLSTDWIELERPADWTERLADVPEGSPPSSVLADHGTPHLVDDAWGYAWLRDGKAVLTKIGWSKHGAIDITTTPLPAPTPRGLVA